MSYVGASEILPGLWLGDIDTVHDLSFLKDKHIKFIIDCSREHKYPDDPCIELKYRFVLTDRLELNSYLPTCRALDDCCTLIKNNINDYNILIYCDTGNKYAPVLVTAYIIKYTKMDLNDIIKCIQSKRGNFNDNYRSLLNFYQKIIRK